MVEAVGDNGSQAKKPGLIKRLWTKSGLLPIHVILMFKGALPPTIALAAYEAPRVAAVYTTIGYLIAIMSHLSLAIQPRAKFVQAMFISILFTCAGAALALLEIQCVVAARSIPSGGTSTGASGSQEALSYDSSACVVSAVWLFFFVFLANVLRAARPQLMLPIIQFSIFTIVASVYAPSFPTMEPGMTFVRRLLIAFLTGFAIATGVSLFVVPITSRSSTEKQMGGLLNLFKGCIAAHGAYMSSISNSMGDQASQEEKEQAAKLQGLILAAGQLFGKIKLEVGFARKEIAYGHLKPQHYSEIFAQMRAILQPIMGLSTFLEIVRALREHRATSAALPESAEALEAIRKLEIEEWDQVIGISKDVHASFKAHLFLGFDHINYRLALTKKPKESKTKGDVEEKAGESPQPGDPEFTNFLRAQLKKYHDQRNEVIQAWAEQKGLNLPRRFWPTQMENVQLKREPTAITRSKLNQHQLYLILYIGFLTYNIGQMVLKLAEWADARHEDGTMTKKRIINPGWRRIRKLVMEAFQKSDNDETLSDGVNGGTNIFLGDGLKQVKDPEHLPPTSLYQKLTDRLRAIPRLLHSEAASFAFRAAVAAMSIGILAYIRQTRTFFLEQRGMWAMIMTAISMDPHAGQGVFGFVARIGGTAFAMAASIVIWYMCDHNHAGILVVFYFYMSGWILFLVKKPQYAPIAMVSSITVILIIGYELQVDDIGRALATSNGQRYYPVYELGPYRLVTVIIGIAVGFIWTYFPYPITTHGALRKDVGSTLYILANYYSCVHTTIDARLHLGPAYKDQPANSPVKKLDAARTKVFNKSLLMLTRLREYHNFTRFEPPFGGRFPREIYSELLTSIRNVFSYLALITYSSEAFIREPEGQTQEDIEEEDQWLKDFRHFTADTKVTSHELTSSLCLLSAAMRNSQPLPPYLQAPRPFKLGDLMEEIDPELLGIQHFAHPCYAAFAVGEVASAFCTAEVAKITKLVKELVGEVDFSFHVVSTMDDGSSTTSTLWDKEAKTTNGAGGMSSAEKAKGD